MNLSTALKNKNRLAGEIVRQQQILQRENSRRSDTKSNVKCDSVLNKILELSTQLGELKGKIATANVGIYTSLERMAEYKSLIVFYQSLPKRDADEIQYSGRDNEKTVYTWECFISQEKSDVLVADLQSKINDLQDTVDAYNASTTI